MELPGCTEGEAVFQWSPVLEDMLSAEAVTNPTAICCGTIKVFADLMMVSAGGRALKH
jgi:hypothetical protein